MARCPECRRFFCRECVTEHDGRLMCRGCLATAGAVAATAGSRWRQAVWPLLGAAGWLLAWILFYYVGLLLARIPHAVHEAGAG